MTFTRESLLEGILERYSRWYNTARAEEKDAPLVATASFHEHGTGYILVRKAEMWSADRHEYSYFYSVPRLTPEIYEACIQKTLELGNPLINPDKSHMCTVLAAIFLCDEIDEAAARAVKKCRIRKSFQFSLKGWMEVHTAAVDLGKGTVTGNSAGRNAVKFLKSMLYPKHTNAIMRKIRK